MDSIPEPCAQPEPGAGDTADPEGTVHAPSEYWGTLLQMQKRAQSVRETKPKKILRKTFSGYIARQDGLHYIDASWYARHSRDTVIKGERHRQPPIYVHCYSVADMFDEQGKKRVANPNERGGYYIQIGLDRPYGLYVTTTRADEVQRVIDRVLEYSKTATSTETAQGIGDATVEFFRSAKNPDRPQDDLVIRRGFMTPPLRSPTTLSWRETGGSKKRPAAETPEIFSEPKTFREYEHEKETVKGHAFSPEGEHATQKNFDYRGYVTSERGEDPQFRDEHIVAFQGERLVETEGVSSKERRKTARVPLMIPSDLRYYLLRARDGMTSITAFVRPFDMPVPHLCHEIMTDLFAEDARNKHTRSLRELMSIVQQRLSALNYHYRDKDYFEII